MKNEIIIFGIAVTLLGESVIFAQANTLELPGEGYETAALGMEKSPEDRAKIEEKIRHLEQRLALLEKRLEKAEIESIRAAAEKFGDLEVEGAGEEQPRAFMGVARALQAQNPEISLTGDFVGRLYVNEDLRKPYFAHWGQEDEEHEHGPEESDLSGFEMRTLEIHFQSNLDPFSFLKASLDLHGTEFDVDEAYITWTGILPRFSLTAGRFRQQFGVVSRWHEHALDQVDLPKSLELFFGDHGLAQTGISVKVLLPRLWAHANELTVEVTNAENGSLFAGEFWSVPSFLGHLKNYYDFSPSTYLEVGLSGIWGFNNRRGFLVEDEATGEGSVQNEPWRSTMVSGIDLTVAWAPPEQRKYRWFVWRTEGMYLWKETEGGIARAFAGFTYFDFRVSQIFIVGTRIDAGQNPQIEARKQFVQVSPYLTAWLSEWVFLRLQYNYLWQQGGRKLEHLLLLQIDFSAGPHKHEKY